MVASEQWRGRGGFGYGGMEQVTEQDYLSDLAAHYRDRLLKEANLEKLTELPSQVMRAKVESLVSAMIREERRIISSADRARLITFITNEAAGYGPLEPLLRDPSVTEIMVNGPQEIYIERAGMLQRRSDVFFRNQDHIRHIIDRIVSPLGRRIDESSPMVDARLPDGSRVNAIIPPLALNGPTITIRRFRRQPITAEDLIRFGTLSQEMMDFLRACVIAKLNILVSGGTGSGKTTLLNVLASFIPGHERIITIEDAAELQFWRMHPHVLRQEARPPNVEGKGEVTIRQLLRNALRMRPNRIVIGEVRGGETLDMLQAMNTGHEGSMTTVHANAPHDAFSRLETMVMWAGTELPSAAIREQLVGALDFVIQEDRMPDGTRKVTRISEIQGVKRGQIILRDIFIFDMIGLSEGGQVEGNHTPTGITPKSLPRLKAYGVEPDRKIFVPAYLVAEMGPETLKDQKITEIMVNGPNHVYMEQNGRLVERPDIRFRDETHLLNVINTIVAPLGRIVDEDHPMVDARLPDGSRVNAVLKPVGLEGPFLTIRRFPDVPLTVEKLIEYGSLDERMVEFLRACVIAKLNVLISGGTGSGKTTLLNVLSSFIPSDERIVTVEDAAELQLQQPHVARLESRPPDEEGEFEVTIRDLVRNALRMRPDRVIVGEVRGAETLDMLQAMNTGHEGSMTTVHANSPHDAFSRLETMVMWADVPLPSSAIREQLASAMHVVIQQDRMPDGTRKITRISEVQGFKRGQIILRDIFTLDIVGYDSDDDGRMIANHTPTGVLPRQLPRLKAHGVELAPKLFEPAYLVAEMGEKLLKDEKVTEIMVNSPEQVYVEREGHLQQRKDIRFRDETHVLNVINTIVAPLGRRVDEDNPMVDARLPDGSRVNAVLKPVALEGPVLTIRRFPQRPLTIEDLVNFGSLDERMVQFLGGCVAARLNVLVSGGTGSGKTTLLNVLSSFIPSHERIVTIEDAAELQLHQPHVVRLEARPPDEEGEGEITIRDLVRNALRMRPDRIIVGEVRGAEALDMLQAMNTGHEGSLTTVHANSPHDAFSRLETMVMWADVPLPSISIREQMASAMHVVIQQNRMVDGSRKIAAISEVEGMDDDGHIILHDIFKFASEGLDKDGKVLGGFVATGYVPTTLERMTSFGVTMPETIFRAQRKRTTRARKG